MVGRRLRRLIIGAAIVCGLYRAGAPLLAALGGWLVADDAPEQADAIVVLSSGVDIYPRLVHAARLYTAGRAAFVIINGDRRNAAWRELEQRGFERPCPWDAEIRAILEFLGVPGERIVSVSAPDAYDTVSEAAAVIPALRQHGWKRIIVTTSDYHSRRARTIWQALAPDLAPRMSAVVDGQFEPKAWWRDGRQIRWVLAEYGGWLAQYWWL